MRGKKQENHESSVKITEVSSKHAEWDLNEFQQDLHEMKEHASRVQNIFYLKS